MLRGTDEASRSLFSYVDLEARVPARHPLRKIRQVVNEALSPKPTDRCAFPGETVQAEAIPPDVLSALVRDAIEAR